MSTPHNKAQLWSWSYGVSNMDQQHSLGILKEFCHDLFKGFHNFNLFVAALSFSFHSILYLWNFGLPVMDPCLVLGPYSVNKPSPTSSKNSGNCNAASVICSLCWSESRRETHLAHSLDWHRLLEIMHCLFQHF